MKSYKVTLDRGGEATDVLISVEPAVTVADLAHALSVRGRPAGGTHLTALPATARTLAVTGPDGTHTLDVDGAVERSGLRSGVTVSVIPASDSYPAARADDRAALLTIRSGPDRGREPIWLPAGTSTIGRDPRCAVTLTDPLVSQVHARVNVTDVIEIVDNNSTNGTAIDGAAIARGRLRSGQIAQVGDTEIAIEMQAGAGAATVRLGASGAAAGHFNRSPRVDPAYPGQVFEAPEPPKRPAAHRFPTIALIAPLLVGGALFLLTHSVLSLMFVALSPLMLVGTFAENAFADRRALRAATAAFEAALAKLNADLLAAAETERERRQAEHPSTAEMVAAGARRTNLLWTRRPEHAGFLQLRLGLGRLPSRNTVELPSKNDVIPALWTRLTSVIAAHATTADVPVVADLRETGALGVAGYDRGAVPVAAGLIAQLVTLHAPSEVVLAAVMSSTSARAWSWLKWLPHTSPHPVSPHTPLRGPHLTADAASATGLLSEIDDLIEVRQARAAPRSEDQPPLPAVVLLVEDDADADRGRLVDIAERGPVVGVYVIWVASTVEALPAVCRTFVESDRSSDTGPVGFVHRGDLVSPVALEPLPAAAVEQLARALAPVADAGARVNDDSGLPRSASFLELAESAIDSSVMDVLARWEESGSLRAEVRDDEARVDVGLRALIGVRGVDALGRPEPLHVDLRREGPHALVGGTTGAGKSELLQAWILGMATALSPLRVTFLFIDYKGGAAFGDCKDLPHSVGLVTDLSLRQVHRALASLRAEVTHREEVLHSYGAKDLVELELSSPDAAPPRLVIVVDEFAALRAEVPEFVDGVVDVAARGRSLGLHLILATQHPATAITDALRANTNLRLALRMADDAASVDVLGNPIAGGFAPDIPGRAAVKTGPGRLVTFQTAYAGGWSNGEPTPPQIVIETLGFGPGQVLADPTPRPRVSHADRGPNDVARIVRTIASAADAMGLPRPRLPWQPELPSTVDLAALRERAATREAHDLRRHVDALGGEIRVADRPETRLPIVFGRRDLPRLQITPPAAFYPDRDGNLVVYGAGGAGKSTALRTIALSALFDDQNPCHVYGIEFGGRGLSLLEPLPQVGAVIRGDDTPRLARLFAHLQGLIESRRPRFDAAHATTIADYWQRTGDLTQARVLLLVDGVGEFGTTYPAGMPNGMFEKLLAVAAYGREVGVHMVAAAERGNAVGGSLASTIRQRVYLRMAGDNDYGMVGLRPDSIAPDAPAGRGVFGGEDIQIAVYGGVDQAAQHRAIEALVARSAAVNGAVVGGAVVGGAVSVAPPIEVLGRHVHLSDLPAHVADKPVFGRSEALEPVVLPSGGAFVVTGPGASGRTTALRAIVASVRRWRPAARLCYLGGRPGSEIADLAGWEERAVGLADAAALIDKLTATPARNPIIEPIVIVVEAIEELFVTTPTVEDAAYQKTVLAALEAFVRDKRLVVMEGDPIAFTRNTLAFARDRRTGLLMRANPDHGSAIGVSVPRGMTDFPQGRGLVFHQGAPTVVQVALVE